MIIILIAYIALILFGLKIRKDKSEYMSKQTTSYVKGIFTIMILLSHFNSYANIDTKSVYFRFISLFGQLMVTMFFFYSGYGVMESIKKKKDYMAFFFRNRFLKTLLHFDIAILIYIIISIISNNIYSAYTYTLSLIGWTSIGNSNWFVFVMLVEYLITYISYIIFKNGKKFIISIVVLSSILIIILYFIKEIWWYNIILCYPFGMIYSLYKNKIELFVKKPVVSFAILLTLFMVAYKFSGNVVIYELLSCIFCLLIVNLMYLFEIGNKVLNFFGVYSFEIYILQRIPYGLLKDIFKSDVLYFTVSLGITIAISITFKYITNKIDKKLFIPKNVIIKKEV